MTTPKPCRFCDVLVNDRIDLCSECYIIAASLFSPGCIPQKDEWLRGYINKLRAEHTTQPATGDRRDSESVATQTLRKH
jgi:hypothetical protein